MIYTVRSGDTLGRIAQRFGAGGEELARANGIEDPDRIFPGQTLKIPDNPSPGRSTGNAPAPGTTHDDYLRPVDAPIRGEPGARSAAIYDEVIDQFAVEVNPRYRPRDYDTYCNIFVWDVTRAMGAEIPHLVGENGEPVSTYQGRWLSANDTNQWLNVYGPWYGWREVSAEEAQALANLGHPIVASVHNDTETDAWHTEAVGHMGIVRPGEMPNGPALAQAGIHNLDHAHVYDHFPIEGTKFFANDTGTVTGDSAPR